MNYAQLIEALKVILNANAPVYTKFRAARELLLQQDEPTKSCICKQFALHGVCEHTATREEIDRVMGD